MRNLRIFTVLDKQFILDCDEEKDIGELRDPRAGYIVVATIVGIKNRNARELEYDAKKAARDVLRAYRSTEKSRRVGFSINMDAVNKAAKVYLDDNNLIEEETVEITNVGPVSTTRLKKKPAR